MTNLGRIGRSIGTMVSGLEARILGWISAHVSLTPRAFGTWLDEHNFIRLENGAPVTDYAGFFRWTRNSLLSLMALTLLLEAYTIVIGTFNNTPLGLGISLGFGVAVFGIASVVWIWRTIGRVNEGLAWIFTLATATLALIGLGTPTYQYYAAGNLAKLSAKDIQNLIAAGIPRIWAMAGFCLLSLIVLPLTWMTTLGPALLSLAFAKTAEGLETAWTEIRKIFSHDREVAEAAAENLRKRTETQTGLLMLTWAILALFTLSIILSSTVWGPFGGLVIGMTAIVPVWIRRWNMFLGTFLTKALYGVATGGLIFICFLYGLSLSALMLIPDQISLNALLVIKWASFLIGLASAVGVLFTSTTASKQNELEAGMGEIQPYTRKVTGFGTDGQPIFEAVHPKPTSFAWVKPTVFGAVVIALVAYVHYNGNPLSGTSPLKLVAYTMVVGLILILFGIFSGGKTQATPTQEVRHDH